MKLPRDLSGQELAQTLKILGYQATRQTGSHLRLTTSEKGIHHVTIPQHGSLRVGTLAAILSEIANHFEMSREEIEKKIFHRKQTFQYPSLFTMQGEFSPRKDKIGKTQGP